MTKKIMTLRFDLSRQVYHLWTLGFRIYKKKGAKGEEGTLLLRVSVATVAICTTCALGTG